VDPLFQLVLLFMRWHPLRSYIPLIFLNNTPLSQPPFLLTSPHLLSFRSNPYLSPRLHISLTTVKGSLLLLLLPLPPKEKKPRRLSPSPHLLFLHHVSLLLTSSSIAPPLSCQINPPHPYSLLYSHLLMCQNLLGETLKEW